METSSVGALPPADPSLSVNSQEVSSHLGTTSSRFLPPPLPPSDPKLVRFPPPRPCPSALRTGGGGCHTTARKSPTSESVRWASWGEKRAIWFSEPRPGWVSSEQREALSRGLRRRRVTGSRPTRSASAAAPYWRAGSGGGAGRSPAHSRAGFPGTVCEPGRAFASVLQRL